MIGDEAWRPGQLQAGIQPTDLLEDRVVTTEDNLGFSDQPALQHRVGPIMQEHPGRPRGRVEYDSEPLAIDLVHLADLERKQRYSAARKPLVKQPDYGDAQLAGEELVEPPDAGAKGICSM